MSVNVLQLIDRVFLALYARYRRKQREPDAAFSLAEYQVLIFLMLLLAMLVTTTFIVLAGDQDLRSQAQITVVLLGLVMLWGLRRRFSALQAKSMPIAPQESKDEQRLIRVFRLGILGLLAAGGLLLVLLGPPSRS